MNTGFSREMRDVANLNPIEGRPPPRRSRAVWVFWIIALVAIVPTGVGFVNKFVHLMRTWMSGEEGAFAIVPISNYTWMALGFLCMLVWATANGMFRDVEKPKYTMLEREEQLDRADRQQRSP
jgi:hypothetical protein